MFLPKPVRALALASTILLIFLLLQLSRKAPPVKEPRIVYPDMKTDPNLEGLYP